MLRLIVLSSLLALAFSQTTDVSQCINHEGEIPINTYIEGCPSPTTPCPLPQRQDAVVNIVFKAPRTMRSMTTLATAYLVILGSFLGPGIPYPLGQNAVTCNFLQNTYCPVMKDEVMIYQLRMLIEEFFPANTEVVIEFRVVDENRLPAMCLRARVLITPPVNSTAPVLLNVLNLNN